jgi:hypothetical protein
MDKEDGTEDPEEDESDGSLSKDKEEEDKEVEGIFNSPQ